MDFSWEYKFVDFRIYSNQPLYLKKILYFLDSWTCGLADQRNTQAIVCQEK